MGSQGLSGDTPPTLEQRWSRILTWAGVVGLQEGQGSCDRAAQQSSAAQWPRVGRTVGLGCSCRKGRAFLTTAAPDPCPGTKGNLVLPAPAERKRAVTPSCDTCVTPSAQGQQPCHRNSQHCHQLPCWSPQATSGCSSRAGFDPLQAHP